MATYSRRRLQELYEQASKEPFPPWQDFVLDFARRYSAVLETERLTPPVEALRDVLLSTVASIYRQLIYKPPAATPSPYYVDRQAEDYMARITFFSEHQSHYNTIINTLIEFATIFCRLLPSSFRLPQTLVEQPAPFLVDFKLFVDDMASWSKLVTPLERLISLTTPPQGWAYELAARNLKVTIKVPYGNFPDAERFQHQWIVAPSGTGKTTLLETLITCDLPRVERGEASVFIMDSQNELIPKLTQMAVFHPGGALHGKLVVLEPETDYPLALNIFDNQLGDTERFTTEEREILFAGTLEMADFVMSGLLGAELTAKQKGIFRYITQALQVIPDATIRTFADLLTPEGYELHREHILTLDDYTVDFFEKRFNTQSFTSTKQEIFWRLDAIMANTTFRRMFSHPKNKLNLFDELQSAKVICVNTKLGLLKQEGTEIFGRYFLAMLLQATERRMLIDREKRLPTFCYIDECQDYIADEPKMAALLDKARKQKVGFTLAHQRLANIKNSDVLNALANVRVKYAARNRTDADYLAKLMQLDPYYLANTPEFHFYLHPGDRAVLVTCSPNAVDGAPKASTEQVAAFRDEMRRRYSEPASATSRSRSFAPQAAPAEAPQPARTPSPRRSKQEESDTPGDW